MIGFVVFARSGVLKLFGPILARANTSSLDPDPNLRIRIQRSPKKNHQVRKNAIVKFADPDPINTDPRKKVKWLSEKFKSLASVSFQSVKFLRVILE